MSTCFENPLSNSRIIEQSECNEEQAISMYEYWKDILFFLDWETFTRSTTCIDTNDLSIQGSEGIPFSQ